MRSWPQKEPRQRERRPPPPPRLFLIGLRLPIQSDCPICLQVHITIYTRFIKYEYHVLAPGKLPAGTIRSR